MYLYLIPANGFNDILCSIGAAIRLCKKMNRTLLIDGKLSCYNINFKDYFYYLDVDINIIMDSDIVKNIVSNKNLSTYPTIFEDRDMDNWLPTLNKYATEQDKNIHVTLMNPYLTHTEDIIFYLNRTGGKESTLWFKHVYFTPMVIEHVNTFFCKLEKPYLCIQVRNTDYKSDYKLLYETNKDLIHSYDTIYVATDDKNCVDFFKSTNLNIINFTNFSTEKSVNLHYSCVNPDTKFKNLICDIYIIVMSDILLTNSGGGFYNLYTYLRENKCEIKDKF
jgi:hypothetical protein